MTVYEMPDIEYRMTEEFRGLDGQRSPREDILRGIFEQARFDTRFYERLDAESSTSAFGWLPYIGGYAQSDADRCRSG